MPSELNDQKVKRLLSLLSDKNKVGKEGDEARELWRECLMSLGQDRTVERGTSSRRVDPLASLGASLLRREQEVRTTMASIYTRTHQELGYPHTTEELVDGMVEKLNLLPKYPHELNFERQKVGEAFMRFKDKKGFLDWYREEYCE